MRNLKLLYRKCHKYGNIKTRLMSQHEFDNISFVYDFKNILKSIDHNSGEIKDLCLYDGVIALDYINLNDCLCFATDAGEIVQFNLSSSDSEVVGLINDGIMTMSWSPDQELVVFVTK